MAGDSADNWPFPSREKASQVSSVASNTAESWPFPNKESAGQASSDAISAADSWPFPNMGKIAQVLDSDEVNAEVPNGEWPLPPADKKSEATEAANGASSGSEPAPRFKHLGVCPFCSASTRPVVLEENTVRRDICECSECSEKVLVCRTPGCQDYAKGGSVYDDELCPGCTSAAVSNAGSVVIGVGTVVLGALATAFMDNKNNKS